MSKTKKFISIILAIIVLAGVGFGAYLLFGKKKNTLTEERAIKLVGETTDELQSAITTVGSGVAGTANSGNSNQLSASNSLGVINSASSKQEICVEFLDRVKMIYGSLEEANYALSLNGTKMQFGQTYMGQEDGDEVYYGIYRDENNVVFEYGYDKDSVEKIIIEYNQQKNKPSSVSYFNVYEDRGQYAQVLEFEMSSINFVTDMYSSYKGRIQFPSGITGDALTNAYNTLEDKIVEGITLTAMEDYLKELGSGYERGFSVLTGNIANNVDDIVFMYKDCYPNLNDGVFNNYSSNISNMEYFKPSKFNLDFKDAKNLTNVYDNMMAVAKTVERQYTYGIFNDKFYFYGVNDLKDFDHKILSKLSTELNALGADNDEYIKLKPVVDALLDNYSTHKNDSPYVSILFGKCDYLELNSINATIENGSINIYENPSNKIVAEYHARVEIDGSSYDLETQLKEF